MPEANVLYSVTAAVVAGLLVWVAVVLKTAKEPWARETVPAATASTRDDDVPIEPEDANARTSASAKSAESVSVKAAEPAATSVPPSSSLPKVLAGSTGGAGADTTAEATAVVVAQKKADASADADAKADEKADAKANADADGDEEKAKADAKA